MHKSILALVVASFASVCTHAGEGEWKKSYVGGNYEFFSEKSDLRLYIGCPTADTSPDTMSSVFLTRLSTDRSIGIFKIIANGHTYDGPIETVSRVGSSNFKALMQDIRVNGATVKYALGTVVFSKANAAKFFPAVNDKLPCQTNW